MPLRTKRRPFAGRAAWHAGRHPVVQQFGNKVVAACQLGHLPFDLVLRRHAEVVSDKRPL